MGDKRKRKTADTEPVEPTRHIRTTRMAAIRDTTGEFAIDDVNHRMWFLATSVNRCDDNMAIDATAWERDMPEHVSFVDSHARDTIKKIYGKVVAARYTSRGPIEQVDFAADPVHPDGQLAWYLYRNGYASDVSIAWTTLEHEKRTTDDGQEYVGVTRARQEELSGCIIGLDPAAEAIHSDDGLLGFARAVACGNCAKCAAEREGTRPGWDEPEDGHMIHYRVREPEDFTGKFVTLSLDVKATADVQVVRGHLKDGDEEIHAQSVRFDKDDGWTMSEAKDWWAGHKDELGRGVKGAGESAATGTPGTQRGISEIMADHLDKILALVTEIRLAQAAARGVAAISLAPTEDAKEPEPDPLALRLKKVAAGVTVTDEELIESFKRR